jgi:hypothetical protein
VFSKEGGTPLSNPSRSRAEPTPARGLPSGGHRVRGRLHHLPGGAEEHLPRWGERRATGTSQEQRRADLAFDQLDLLAQRRRRDVQAGGRAAEVELLGDRDEVAHLPKLHTLIVRAPAAS